MAREACANVWEKRQQHNELAIVGYVYKFKRGKGSRIVDHIQLVKSERL